MFNLGHFLGAVLGNIGKGAGSVANTLLSNQLHTPTNWSHLTPQQQAAFKPTSYPDTPGFAAGRAQAANLMYQQAHPLAFAPQRAVASQGPDELTVQPSFNDPTNPSTALSPLDQDTQALSPTLFGSQYYGAPNYTTNNRQIDPQMNPSMYNQLYKGL